MACTRRAKRVNHCSQPLTAEIFFLLRPIFTVTPSIVKEPIASSLAAMKDLDVESLQSKEDKRRRKRFAKVVLHVSTHGCRVVRVRSKYGYTKTGISSFRNPLRRGWYSAHVYALFCIAFFISVLVFRDIFLQEGPHPSIRQCSINCMSAENPWGHSGSCTPVTDIFFLKTHKCASSSIQNILMRFGDKRNLTFVLPTDTNYIGHPEKFSRSMISSQRKPINGFNILCHHLRLNTKEVRSVLRPSAVFLTVLREPVNLFRSMYDYYEISNYTGQTLDEFMRNESSMADLAADRFRGRIGNNQMMFDLGYDSKDLYNETKINEAIGEVDDTFDLVMIAELFDESLILLKHMLCWSMEDILYLVHNRRMMDAEKTPYYNETSEKIREYNQADQMLYDYFLRKLNDAIDKFGRERMAQEVEELKTWNKVWYDHCVGKISESNKNVPTDNRAYSSKVYSFVLKDKPVARICTNLAMVEIPYTHKLIEKQKQMF